MLSYIERIYSARYFWLYLSLSDLNQKYRRSYLGIVWAVIQPLGMTALLTLVLGNLFGQSMADYAPFIFSGLIAWEYISNAVVGGCNAFSFSQYYIRQCTHPYAIYTLRHALTGFMNFSLAFIGLVLWVLIWKPSNFGLSWIVLPISFCLFLLVNWLAATVCAFISTWFHDFSQAVTLLLQTLWFISPVTLKPEMFRSGNMSLLVDYNPIYHILQLFRAPLLTGKFPLAENFAFSFGFLLFLFVLLSILVSRKEKSLIFYF
jgi:lipopolysaccharide transport system permease protein